MIIHGVDADKCSFQRYSQKICECTSPLNWGEDHLCRSFYHIKIQFINHKTRRWCNCEGIQVWRELRTDISLRGDWYSNTPRHMVRHFWPIDWGVLPGWHEISFAELLLLLLSISITVLWLFFVDIFLFPSVPLPQPGVPARIPMQWRRLGCGLWDRVAAARQLPRHCQPASARPRSHRRGKRGCLLFDGRGLHRIHHAPLQPAYYESLSKTL